jgi:hypothetical protein
LFTESASRKSFTPQALQPIGPPVAAKAERSDAEATAAEPRDIYHCCLIGTAVSID